MYEVVEGTLQLSSVGLDDLDGTATKILNFCGSIRVILLFGELGSGKTTLVQAMGRVLEVKDHITSPTFSIINEYLTAKGEVLYHFDCYRLRTLKEAIDIDMEDYFYSGRYCFVEWPEIVGSIWPAPAVKVSISRVSESLRSMSIHKL